MTDGITRRQALKIGTSAALSAAVNPLLSRASEGGMVENSEPAGDEPFDTHGAVASNTDICFMPARQMADLIHQKKLSAREVMQAHLKQIQRVNSKVNAILTLVP